MKRAIVATVLLSGFALADPSKDLLARRAPLAAFLGHWEGGGQFNATKFSKAHEVKAESDCNWSPQGRGLICEQAIDEEGERHTQLTLYLPNLGDDGFTFYTVDRPGQKAPAGALSIQGNVWTYGPQPGAPKSFPRFRTINSFRDSVETFKVEFTEDGTHWTTMLDGQMKRTAIAR